MEIVSGLGFVTRTVDRLGVDHNGILIRFKVSLRKCPS